MPFRRVTVIAVAARVCLSVSLLALRVGFTSNHSLAIKMATPKKGSRKASGKAVSQSKRAGLVLPVGRIGSMLRKGCYAPRVSRTAAIVMTSALEYIVAELLELSAKAVLQRGKGKRITPRALTLAVRHDADLGALL